MPSSKSASSSKSISIWTRSRLAISRTMSPYLKIFFPLFYAFFIIFRKVIYRSRNNAEHGRWPQLGSVWFKFILYWQINGLSLVTPSYINSEKCYNLVKMKVFLLLLPIIYSVVKCSESFENFGRTVEETKQKAYRKILIK